MVMNYFTGLADEVRELLAELGVEKLTDLIGRTDLLEAVEGFTAKQTKLDLSNILEAPISAEGHPLFWTEPNKPFDKAELNQKIVDDALNAVENSQSASFFYNIINTDRSVGARLSGEIAKRYGNQGLAASPIKIYLDGTAGQSFGVWNAGGVELYLTGDANDYVGKGMAGGKIAIKPHLALHLNVTKPPLSVTHVCTARQEANCLLRVKQENVLVFVTLAPSPS